MNQGKMIIEAPTGAPSAFMIDLFTLIKIHQDRKACSYGSIIYALISALAHHLSVIEDRGVRMKAFKEVEKELRKYTTSLVLKRRNPIDQR
jgi:hypothetical protein